MKLFLVVFASLSVSFAGAQADGPFKKKAESAILAWADEKFEHYTQPRFENFLMSPSPEYYAMQVLRDEYKTFKEEIVYNFHEGQSDRSEEQVKKDTTSIQKKIKELDDMLSSIEPKFDHIEYFMWANIQTDNGLTVYYQHHFKLDQNYKIVSFRESGAVGKPEDVEILYKNY